MLSIFSCAYWPFMYLLGGIIYSNPLPIFIGFCLAVTELGKFTIYFTWLVEDSRVIFYTAIPPEHRFCTWKWGISIIKNGIGLRIMESGSLKILEET